MYFYYNIVSNWNFLSLTIGSLKLEWFIYQIRLIRPHQNTWWSIKLQRQLAKSNIKASYISQQMINILDETQVIVEQRKCLLGFSWGELSILTLEIISNWFHWVYKNTTRRWNVWDQRQTQTLVSHLLQKYS